MHAFAHGEAGIASFLINYALFKFLSLQDMLNGAFVCLCIDLAICPVRSGPIRSRRLASGPAPA